MSSKTVNSLAIRFLVALSAVSCLLLVGLTLTGCGQGSQRGMVSVSAIGPNLRTVAERHDRYVLNDASLSEVERNTYLRSTELLIRVVDQAEAGQAAASVPR